MRQTLELLALTIQKMCARELRAHSASGAAHQLLLLSIANHFEYSTHTIYRRLRNIGYTLKLDKWVPYKLSDKNKAERVGKCKQLLEKLKNEPFLGYKSNLK